jgi:hypothetical protein
MNSPTNRDNGQDNIDLIVNDLPDSTGDLVQQRFDYQNKYASILAIGMYEGKIPYREILCEKLDDILAVRNDDKLEVIQVKTRENAIPFSLNDSGVKETILHFIDYELTYPGKFTAYRIVSNCGFREQTLTNRQSFIQLLKDESHSDISTISQVFKKLKLQKGPGLKDIDARLESQLGRMQVFEDKAITFNQVENMSNEIVGVVRASSESKVENSLKDYVTFIPDGLKKEKLSVLERKRITAEKINRIILDYAIRARNHNITILKNLDDLSYYYHVYTKNIIDIHRDQIDLLNTNLKLNIPNRGRWNKPILLITGKPGIGKSWFAYRHTSGLMSKGTVLYRVTSGQEIDKIHNDHLVETQRDSSVPSGVFVLDDYWISIGETVSSSLTAANVSQLIKSYFVSENEHRTPLVISMREETWEFVTTRAQGKLDPVRLNHIVERIVLPQPTYAEADKIVRSFYASVDNGQPPFPHLNVSSTIKEKIIEKSNSSPIIIKLFFEYVASKSNGREYSVQESDVNEIIQNAIAYVLQLIFTYYLFGPDDDIHKTLALLYSIASVDSLSIGHLIYLSKKLPDPLPPNITPIISLSRHKSPPLFEIDMFGFLMPFHESVRDAVMGLVQQPHRMIENIPEHYTELKDQIRRIIHKEADSIISESNRSRTNYSPSYDKSLLDSMNFYINRIENEKERFGVVLGETIFAYLSTFLEFLESSTRLHIDSSTGNEYIGKMRTVLEKTEIKYEDHETFVLSQIYYIFKLLNLLERPDKNLKRLYIKLMSAKNFAVRSGIWNRIEKLLDARILTPEEVMNQRHHFFDTIKMIDADSGQDISGAVLKLIQEGVITPEHQRRFLDLLCDPREGVRTSSWGYVLLLTKNNIVPREEVIQRSKYFLQLFNSVDNGIILTVWYGVVYLVYGDLIKREELPNKDRLFDLLKDPVLDTKRRATITIVALFHAGLLTSSEIRLFIPHFVELLQGPDLYMILSIYDRISPMVVLEEPREKDIQFITKHKTELKSADHRSRFVAWISLTVLFHSRVLLLAEIEPFKGNFIEMLKTNDHQVRKNFWLIVPNLTLFGLISVEEVIANKKYLLELLDSSNMGIRWLGWNAIIRIVDKKILSQNDVEPYSNKLYELPLMTRDIRFREAAFRLVRSYEDILVEGEKIPG